MGFTAASTSPAATDSVSAVPAPSAALGSGSKKDNDAAATAAAIEKPAMHPPPESVAHLWESAIADCVSDGKN